MQRASRGLGWADGGSERGGGGGEEERKRELGNLPTRARVLIRSHSVCPLTLPQHTGGAPERARTPRRACRRHYVLGPCRSYGPILGARQLLTSESQNIQSPRSDCPFREDIVCTSKSCPALQVRKQCTSREQSGWKLMRIWVHSNQWIPQNISLKRAARPGHNGPEAESRRLLSPAHSARNSE